MGQLEFAGFPEATFEFLNGISAHNEKAWFEAHRDLCEAGYIAPARALVEQLGPRLRELSPTVQFAPKVNGSLSRINRDIRFSKDKSPYKTHLDLWFWHGDKRGWDCPGFYLRLTADRVFVGVGMHAMPGPMLARFRDAIDDEVSGTALAAAVGKVEAAGYTINTPTRKRVPRGYRADHPRAGLLLRDSLNAGTELPAEAARETDFGEICLARFRGCWPVGKWLLETVA